MIFCVSVALRNYCTLYTIIICSQHVEMKMTDNITVSRHLQWDITGCPNNTDICSGIFTGCPKITDKIFVVGYYRVSQYYRHLQWDITRCQYITHICSWILQGVLMLQTIVVYCCISGILKQRVSIIQSIVQYPDY